MKIAIISVSKKGYELSLKLKELLDKDSTVIKTDLFHKNVKDAFSYAFSEYDGIIAIMASGILIRSIAPLINSKISDPAIVNMDDNGKFVISTLSGHLGGANKLTNKIASLIDATPVITTSTDVNKKLGIDVLAKDLYLDVINPEEILFFNKSILEGRKLNFYLNPDKNFSYLFTYLNKNTLEINLSISYSSKIKNDEIHIILDEHELILKERKIVVGIGCKREKECSYIYNGFKQSLDELDLDISRVNLIASAEIKKDEKGLIELSQTLEIPLQFVSMDKLKLFKSNDVQKSEFVYSKFGIYGVCEPSALICAGFDSKLLYKKTSYNGVTISVAISKKNKY